MAAIMQVMDAAKKNAAQHREAWFRLLRNYLSSFR